MIQGLFRLFRRYRLTGSRLSLVHFYHRFRNLMNGYKLMYLGACYRAADLGWETLSVALHLTSEYQHGSTGILKEEEDR